MGIRVEGCLLTCEGAEACPTCKDDPAEYHGARYLTPFTPEHPHFEVLHNYQMCFFCIFIWLDVRLFTATFADRSFAKVGQVTDNFLDLELQLNEFQKWEEHVLNSQNTDFQTNAI